MRLEKIVLDGFKSFADKTEFSFDSPITAIVGPNGCGKSNVVDAVKWVLGEQSVKSLRSGQMADVIFSGSSSRKAVGTAEVSLFISNTTGQLPIEADQVQISRRIYKSGESEYQINNKACRLKDIRELFMDTGLGAKAYSIIEQGQVEQLLTGSKSDRRVIFEEAAGISKYKAHKKEAIRKLERTDQNLLRLADILGEVQKQLRSVKLQAGKARNYLQYTQRLKDLQTNYSLVEYHKIITESAACGDEVKQMEEKFAVVAAEVAKSDAAMSELGRQILETETDINQADNALVSVQSKIEQQLQRIEFLRARTTELQQRKEEAGQRIESIREQKNVLCGELKLRKDEQTNCKETLAEKTQADRQLQQEVREIDIECASLEADLEDEKSGIIDIVRKTAQLHNEVQSISVYRDNLSSQKDRLSGRANTARAELEELLTEKAQHQARAGDIEKVLEELDQNLESNRKQTEEINALLETDNEKLASSKEKNSAMSSKLAVLTDMEDRREGLRSGAKKILQNRGDNGFSYVDGLLADIVAADVEYAEAIEAALEGNTDALVISDTNQLLADMNEITRLDDRVDFLCTDKIEPFADNTDLSTFDCVRGRAVEFVSYQSKYAPLIWSLLGKTIVVNSIEAAVGLAKKIGDSYQFVTLKGEFFNGSGSIKLGALKKTTGLISRKSQIRQLQEAIGNITTEIAELQELIAKNNLQKEHLEKLRKDLRTAIYEANTEKMQTDSRLSITEQNVKRLKEEQPLIAGEIDVLEAQISQSVQKEYESKQQLEELEAVNSARTIRIKELQDGYQASQAKQQQCVSEVTRVKVILGQVAEQNKALEQTIANLASQIQQNQAGDEAAQSEIQMCSQQLNQTQRDILNCEVTVTELFVTKEESQQSSLELHSKVKELIEEQKLTEQLIREKRAEKNEIDQQLNQLKVVSAQLEVKEQGLVEKVQDDLQIDLANSYEDYEEQEIDWEAVREEITELRGKIERLGNVNLDSIDEQEELDKRNEFLGDQLEDLNKSKAQLQQLIGRLNKQSREKFKETFEEIRVHFQQVFRKLFGGGKADILLEDSEDILEAGIEIIARPPGKETMSISLLSGGEKTMTAIALLFSVFKAKPSPFCLLDEVDAALDEANNERFNLLIREFQKDSQFVLITHSKRTMSIADVLYGVTMQTRGVSKKISVRFGETEEETAAVA